MFVPRHHTRPNLQLRYFSDCVRYSLLYFYFLLRSYTDACSNLVQVTVGSLDLSANKDIQQIVDIVEDFGKYRVLVKYLQVR